MPKIYRKPRRLKQGDTVAVVSLSWGGLGDAELIHKYDLARERLSRDFGLSVRPMPHALMGSDFVYRHPELRAKDLHDAFADPDLAAVFCAIGGDDTIRLLPYIDFDLLARNPKIFMGYSDTTINHFMLQHAGLVSFYGPSVMNEFAEYGQMSPFCADAVRRMLFDGAPGEIPHSPIWSPDSLPWTEASLPRSYRYIPDTHGVELLQGSGMAEGHLLGGCADVFMMAIGTSIWPSPEEWRGAILLMETSEDKPSPDFIKWTLRNLDAQGILRGLSGIVVGKPQEEVCYEEYKTAILTALDEAGLTELPVLYNLNVGHARPIGVLPLGVRYRIDCGHRTLTMIENAVI